jgi:hypothetical protein
MRVLVLPLITLAVCTCFALVGCSTRYVNALHPEYGQAAYDRDWYECKRENTHSATYVNPYYGSSGPEVDFSMAQSCMRARGWQPVGSQQQRSQPTPSSYTQPVSPSATQPAKKGSKNVPLCAWGEYWHSVKKECVKIGSE